AAARPRPHRAPRPRLPPRPAHRRPALLTDSGHGPVTYEHARRRKDHTPMPKDPYALLRALLRAEAARDARANRSPEPKAPDHHNRPPVREEPKEQ
ncbi:hypothetical protein, partial [Streptomyces sp. SID14478]|uniref:hypothetical protein n=1 Tax=Streptomyces sp. SID14478 TaxID=2706073 RepID=UPI0019424F8F